MRVKLTKTAICDLYRFLHNRRIPREYAIPAHCHGRHRVTLVTITSTIRQINFQVHILSFIDRDDHRAGDYKARRSGFAWLTITPLRHEHFHMSTINYARLVGIEKSELAGAVVLAAIYVPLFVLNVIRSIRHPTYVLIVLAFFCLGMWSLRFFRVRATPDWQYGSQYALLPSR